MKTLFTFAFGVLVTLLLIGKLRGPISNDRCLGKCGASTRCDRDGRCIAATNEPPAQEVAAKRHRRGSVGHSAAEMKLQPGDEKIVSEGDALGRPEHIDLSKNDRARELSEDEIDRVYRSAQPAITHCITEAVGDAPLERAHVELGLRIERSGEAKKVHVSAPALLQRRGLTHCVRQVVGGLHFSASDGASVVTWPFELQ